MKKGQFTLFIVFGIIILVLIGLFLVLSDSNILDLTEEVQSYDNINDISSQLSECLQVNLEKSLILLGLQGGSLYPTNTIDFESYEISTDEFNINTIQEDLETYLEESLRGCELYGAEYTETPNIKVTITEFKVEADLESDLIYQNRTASVGTVENNINLYEIYDTVQTIKDDKPIALINFNNNQTIEVTKYNNYYIYAIQKGDYLFLTTNNGN